MNNEQPNQNVEIANKWQEQEKNLRKIIEELMAILKSKNNQPGIEFSKIQVEAVQRLKDAGLSKKDQLKSVAYNLLIGSSPRYELCELFDFEGDLSIENFLRKKIAEENGKDIA